MVQDNDLISRTALVEDLSYCAPELFFDKDYLLCKIMKQPAVDAAPVVHGRWILHDEDLFPWFECSECGFTGMATRFCAGCGALMDGGEDDAAD